MEEMISYVKPELLVVSVVLYLAGIALKKTDRIKDKYIPLILGGAGILLCGIWVLSTSQLTGVQSIAMAVFTSIVQGILVAGLSTYIKQTVKQIKKEEKGRKKNKAKRGTKKGARKKEVRRKEKRKGE